MYKNMVEIGTILHNYIQDNSYNYMLIKHKWFRTKKVEIPRYHCSQNSCKNTLKQNKKRKVLIFIHNVVNNCPTKKLITEHRNFSKVTSYQTFFIKAVCP